MMKLIARRPWRTFFLALLAWLMAGPHLAGGADEHADSTLRLTARTRQQATPGSGAFEVRSRSVDWDASHTALIICDLWDKHWCRRASEVVDRMAPRIDALARELRSRGVLIVHAPSDTMKHYEGTPQRRRARDAPAAPTSVTFQWNKIDSTREPALLIDDSDGGCDCDPQCKSEIVWKREHPAVEIFAQDAVSDQGREIYNLFVQRGIRNVLVCGVHANMCVLGRSFGIRQLTRLGLNVLLVRDLTDTMYNHRSAPFVAHDRGTELVIEHIEKYWCGSIVSSQLLGEATTGGAPNAGAAAPGRIAKRRAPNVVVAIAEDEYRAKETLAEFARSELRKRLHLNCVLLQSDSKTDLPGLEALRDADLLVMFLRRRTLPEAQLKLFQAYFESGKPVVAMRTSCHAFQNWLEFDSRVLGCHYNNHYGPGGALHVRPVDSARDHPVLRGIQSLEFNSTCSLYKVAPLATTCTPLLIGSCEGKPPEPIAWVNTHAGGRVFFTSLGDPEDFKLPQFRRLLANGILWAMDEPVSAAE